VDFWMSGWMAARLSLHFFVLADRIKLQSVQAPGKHQIPKPTVFGDFWCLGFLRNFELERLGFGAFLKRRN